MFFIFYMCQTQVNYHNNKFIYCVQRAAVSVRSTQWKNKPPTLKNKIAKYYDKESSENRIKFTNSILGLKYAKFQRYVLCC